MKLWQKLGLITLVPVLIGGTYVFIVLRARENPGVIANKGEAAKPVSQDELAYVKQYLFATFDQAKQMEGTTVWVKAGYALPYFPYAGEVEWGKRAGVLPSAEKLEVKKLVKAAAPEKLDDRVPHGSRQYLAVFTILGKPGQFAAPIGNAEGEQEQILADQLFYYDDPKTIYSHWPQPVWDAVAAHEPKPGMNELQVQMAVGIMQESDSKTIGDRTVTYHAGDKNWTVTYAHGVATQVNAG